MIKGGFSCFILFVLAVGFAGAATVSVTDVNSTLIQVSIVDASSLYGYEVNFSIDSGSVGSVLNPNTHSSFLGSASEASYGSNQKNSYLYAYGSRLDSNKAGKSGDGELFNVSYTGGLTLKGHLLVDTNGTVSYATYNADGTVTVTTSEDSSSGGGLIVNAGIPGLKNIEISPMELNVNVIKGQESEREISIKNTGDTIVNILIITQNLAGIVRFEESEFELLPGEQKVVKVKILTDKAGLIAGKIIFLRGFDSFEVPVVINVRSENFLFDTTISLAERVIHVGDILTAQINMIQVGTPEKIDVVASYVIKDFEGNTYLEESETFFVFEEKEYTKQFDTSNLFYGTALPPGKYALGLEIVYPNAFAVSSAQFEVLGNELDFSLTAFKNNLLLISITGAVIALLVIIAFFAWSYKRKVYSKMRKSKI